MLYEYFVELLLVVIAGIFFASIMEKHFSRLRKFVPGNPVTAFLYASVIPVCSCSVIPFVKALKDKISFNTIITFLVAAPLLNPYIISLSISVLGIQYAVLRIICSFLLAVLTGFIVGFFYKRSINIKKGFPETCISEGGCPGKNESIYNKTYIIFRKILPFMLIAGAISVVVELYAPASLLARYNLNNSLTGTAFVILFGVPVYFCNGADVLFLQPFLRYSELPMGTAMAFSLTSTSVCITSLALLIKFIGRKLTLITLICIIIITFLLSFIINTMPVFIE